MLNKLIVQVHGRIAESSMLRANMPHSQASAIRAILETSTRKATAQRGDVLLPSATLFFCNLGHRSQEQKQKARKLQKTRRQKRRAGIKYARDNLPDEETAGPVDFVPKYPAKYSDGFSSQWGASHFTEDELSRNPDWYWSSKGGWRREKAIPEENGHSKWAYRLSPKGGYLELKPTTVYYGPFSDISPISLGQFASKSAQRWIQNTPGEF